MEEKEGRSDSPASSCEENSRPGREKNDEEENNRGKSPEE